jgi:phage shock protein E
MNPSTFMRSALLAVVLGCVAFTPSSWHVQSVRADSGTITQVTVAEAKQIIARMPDLTVLDVRTPEEFMAGHLPGAVLLPVSDVDQDAVTLVKDHNAPVLVYCKAGKRSAIAVASLKAQGYTRLWDMTGGIVAWEAAGELVER